MNTATRAAFLGTVLAVAFGCSSQAVKTLSERTVTNNELLTGHYATIASSFETQLSREAEVVRNIGVLLKHQCEQSNTSAARGVAAAKAAKRSQLRESFLTEAMRIESEEYPERFNAAYAPMKELFRQAEDKLAALNDEASAVPADLNKAKEVLEQQRTILALANRQSNDDLDLRDKLRKKIEVARDQHFSDIDGELSAVVAPSIADCNALDTEAAALAQALIELETALSREATLLEELGGQQDQALLTLQKHANRVRFYKLILEGANNSVKASLANLSQATSNALADVSSKVGGFINHLSASATTGLSGITNRIDQLGTRLSKKGEKLLSNIEKEIAPGVTDAVKDSLAASGK